MKRKNFYYSTNLIFLFLLFSVDVIGQSIFTNPITNTDPSIFNPFTLGQTVNPNITVSGMGRGVGINGTTGSNRYNASSWNTAGLDATAYFEFTLTPNSSYEINLISFVYTSQASGTGPTSFAFRSSVNGYTVNLGSPSVAGTTLDLSVAAFQNVVGPIIFRFYGWGASAAAGSFSINDFTFNGTVDAVSACSAPTSQVSTFSASLITSATSTIDWLRGNGDNVLVMARAGGAVNQNPINGISYTANASFGLGTQIGIGNFVVYHGSGSSVALTGLMADVTYHFTIYEVNTTGICYQTPALIGNLTTVCLDPTVQALNMTFIPGISDAIIAWTNGNGTKRVVKINTSNSFTPPSNGTNPSVNVTYSGAGEQVIYNGSGSSVTVSGLTAASNYFVRVYEANCTGTSTLYAVATSTNNPISFITASIVGTVLHPGDIAIVGYDAQVNGSGSDDLIAFANMVDLAVGTTFILTDNGFELASTPNVRNYTFGNGEGAISMRWNGPGVLPKGTVTELRTGVIPSGWSRSCISDRNGASAGGCDVFAFNFASAGDQLFILQGIWNEGTYSCPNVNYAGENGCANATFSGTYIFGFNGIAGGWVPTTASPIVVDNDGARRSRLPRELRCFNTEFTTTVARQQYSDVALDNGTQRQLLGTIKGTTDWSAFAVGAFSLGSFVVTTSWTAGQWIGDINTNWFNCANWDNLLVPNATTSVELGAFSIDDADIDAAAQYSDEFLDIALCKNLTITNQKVTLEGSANDKIEVHGNLVINSNSGLDMSDGTNGTPDGQLYLNGNWTNLENETEFKQGESTVHFVGSANQTIMSDISDNEVFYSVVVNKSGGSLSLIGDDDMTIDLTGNMHFVQGIVKSDNTLGSHIIFETTATASGANINSYVDGPVQKISSNTTLFTFPIGDVTSVNLLRPLGLLPSTLATSIFEAEYTGVGFSDYTLGSGVDDVTEREWWRFDRNSGSSNATVTLFWGAESDIPGELTSDINELKVLHFDGTDWDNQGGTSQTGTITSGTVTSTIINLFGAFTLGVDTPLPIALLYFSGKILNNEEVLTWVTSVEINSFGFEIQKSFNGIDFFPVGFVKSSGESSRPNTYSFHTNLGGSSVYYRLKLIDKYDDYQYSTIVTLNHTTKPVFFLHPNPATSSINLIVQNVTLNEDCFVTIINIVGEELLKYNGSLQNVETRINEIINNYSSGLYYLTFQLGNEVHTIKLIIN